MIHIQNDQDNPVDIKALKKDAQLILKHLGYSRFDLGIALVDQKKMHEVNRQYREQDKPTDVLSFPFYPDLKAGEKIVACCNEDKILGDIIFCPSYIQADLERWNQTFEQRMKVLLVHGICHLLGYDHIKDEDYAVMKQKEDELLQLLL